jgi:short-subunit dehydrogenase
VTGASSGIGKAMVERLASQGCNVVMVALDDQMLRDAVADVTAKYPTVSFRSCGCNLGDSNSGYMDKIVKMTSDIDVTLIFNNAGFIIANFFAETELSRLQANLECNATCSMNIAHHFLRRLIVKKQRGFIGFTSSAGAYFPSPTGTVYSPSKAFLTNLACTIQCEVRDLGIDIGVVHPSPVKSNFYQSSKNSNMSNLEAAQKQAVGPEVIVDALFAAAGRLLVVDQGATCAAFRVVNKLLDFAFFMELSSRVAHIFNVDHKTLVSKSKLRAGLLE